MLKGGKYAPNGRCMVCIHPERHRIEFLIARGASRKSLGERFDVGQHAVHNHWSKHVPATVKAAALAKALKPGVEVEKLLDDENAGLLAHLQRIRGVLFDQFDAAAEAGDRHGVSMLSARLHDNLRLGAQKTGELQAHAPKTSITNVVLSPAYLDLRGRLLLALRRYPDAAHAVADAFRAVEAQTGLTGPPPTTIDQEPLRSPHSAEGGQPLDTGDGVSVPRGAA
jgi:hypothetical protein